MAYGLTCLTNNYAARYGITLPERSYAAMSNTSFRRLALSGHQSPPLCGPDNLTRCLAGAKPIRQTRPSRNPLALGHQLSAKPMHRSMTADANPDRLLVPSAVPIPDVTVLKGTYDARLLVELVGDSSL
jgi:hypothetical protein